MTAVRHPSEIRPWSGRLTQDTIHRVRDLIESVLSFRCAVVTIARDISWVNVRTGCTAYKSNRSDELLVMLRKPDDGDGMQWVSWSIDGHFWSLHLGQDIGVSWHEGSLRIDLTAPACHPLVWIFSPEVSDTEGR